jgi:pimeloyl-ACP methyl ester carboxylesterase
VPLETTIAPEGGFTERRAVEVSDGVVLDAWSRGSRDNPAVVLVNAFGMPARFWEPLASGLESRFFLLTWDSRGLLSTDTPFDPKRCGVLEHATDMQAVMHAFGVTKAFAVGWCSGCQVALRYAALPGSNLLGAALLNGTYCLEDEWVLSPHLKMLRTIVPFCTRGVAQARTYSAVLMDTVKNGRDSAPGGGLGDVTSEVPKAIVDMTMGPFSSGEALYRYAHTVKRFAEEPFHAWTDALKAPALVVSGEKDSVAHPQASREIARRLTDSQLVMYANGDHYLHFFDSGVGNLIRDFYDRHIER